MARQMALIHASEGLNQTSSLPVNSLATRSDREACEPANQDTAGSQVCYTNVPIVVSPPSEFNARSEVKPQGSLTAIGATLTC